MTNNVSKIRDKLSEYNIDAMLVTSSVNRLYATGFFSSAGVLLVTPADAWFVIDARYSEDAALQAVNVIVVPLEKNDRYEDKVKELASGCDIKRLGFEEDRLTYDAYKKWSKSLKVKMCPAKKMIADMRSRKSRDELDKMIEAQKLAEKVFQNILPLISTDVTEKDVAAEIIYQTLRLGADKESFSPIVVSGTNSSKPHGAPAGRKLQKGFLTIDFGVCLNGWCSDTTRTLCIGKPDKEMSRVYDTVLQAQLAGIEALYAGVPGAQADAAARAVIEQAGYGKYFTHAFGHSLGLEVHETLSFSALSKDIIPEGAVMSAEPGIYIPGRFGVRIEDVVYITSDGCENITNLPKALTVL